MKLAVQHLVEHGIRPSMQRTAIMKYLLENRTHPSVDTIYNDLRPNMPTLSRTTVYNTLELLLEKNAILGLTIDSHTMHYDGYPEPHAHFLCQECGKIYDIDLPENLKSEQANAVGSILNVELNYYGVCHQCRAKSQN